MHIDTDFEAAAIDHVASPASGSPLRLRLRSDNAAEFAQWFAFELVDLPPGGVDVRIEGLAGSSYPKGWVDYRVCMRADGGEAAAWRRLPTDFDGDALAFHAPGPARRLRFAYFPTFDRVAEDNLVALATQAGATLETLGTSALGEPIRMLSFEGDAPRTRLWFMARQHPGESQGGYCLEGLVQGLCGELRPVWENGGSAVHVVINANPDGVRLGNLRTNARGANLNRCWDREYPDAPETAAVRRRMQALGLDLLVDFHGDEVLPHVFSVGADGSPAWTPRLQALRRTFDEDLLRRSPVFQTARGYSVDRPDHASPRKCIPWVAEQFDALAMTIELPFKESADRPRDDADATAYARTFGRAVLETALALAPSVRP
ncbi:M14 family metallopeptidase [Burkholderia cepacia]|uniref:M14 family metallopeptidase n=1 Tax=Burkholderia cepacia TaxID=292 RepID=UPI002147EBCC|nr:M14-type cytosolic carboxypeptidase [Burkholderia cepacia]